MSKRRDVTTKNRRAITWLVICSFPLIGAGSCGTSRGTLCGKMVDSVSYEGVEGVELTPFAWMDDDPEPFREDHLKFVSSSNGIW